MNINKTQSVFFLSHSSRALRKGIQQAECIISRRRRVIASGLIDVLDAAAAAAAGVRHVLEINPAAAAAAAEAAVAAHSSKQGCHSLPGHPIGYMDPYWLS
jgi:hypothetical protein